MDPAGLVSAVARSRQRSDLVNGLQHGPGVRRTPRPSGPVRLVWFLTSYPQLQVYEVKNQTRDGTGEIEQGK
jgi:hypothetical protein